jgi:hypothetical protein
MQVRLGIAPTRIVEGAFRPMAAPNTSPGRMLVNLGCEVVVCGPIPMLSLISSPWLCRATDGYTQGFPFDMDDMPSFLRIWTPPDTWMVLTVGANFVGPQGLGP